MLSSRERGREALADPHCQVRGRDRKAEQNCASLPHRQVDEGKAERPINASPPPWE